MTKLYYTERDNRLYDGDLPPWTVYSALCEHCHRRAQMVMTAASVERVGDSIFLGRASGHPKVLVCQGCFHGRTSDFEGSTTAAPLRRKWRWWLAEKWEKIRGTCFDCGGSGTLYYGPGQDLLTGEVIGPPTSEPCMRCNGTGREPHLRVP